MNNQRKVALVTTYSFDNFTPVWLFDTWEEAIAEMKRQFDKEIRIEVKENEKEQGLDFETEFNEQEGYAKIINFCEREPKDDITEWRIGELEN